MENEFDNFDFDVDSFIKRVQAKVKAEVTIDNVNDLFTLKSATIKNITTFK